MNGKVVSIHMIDYLLSNSKEEETHLDNGEHAFLAEGTWYVSDVSINPLSLGTRYREFDSLEAAKEFFKNS